MPLRSPGNRPANGGGAGRGGPRFNPAGPGRAAPPAGLARESLPSLSSLRPSRWGCAGSSAPRRAGRWAQRVTAGAGAAAAGAEVPALLCWAPLPSPGAAALPCSGLPRAGGGPVRGTGAAGPGGLWVLTCAPFPQAPADPRGQDEPRRGWACRRSPALEAQRLPSVKLQAADARR